MGKFDKRNERFVAKRNGTLMERKTRAPDTRGMTIHGYEPEWCIIDELADVPKHETAAERKAKKRAEMLRRMAIEVEKRKEREQLQTLETYGMF